MTKERLKEIETIAKDRGVIVFTDPDYPGSKIRNILKGRIPNCKHAYLNKSEAINPKTGKYGVEYAKPEAIVRALKNAKATVQDGSENYTLTVWSAGAWRGQTRKKGARLCAIFAYRAGECQRLLNKLNAYQIRALRSSVFGRIRTR